MKTTVKRKWLRALRSGEYKQGRGSLKTRAGNFCCLGVLTDLFCHTKEGTAIGAHFTTRGYRDSLGNQENGILPEPVALWADLSIDPRVRNTQLVYLNDNERRSFEEIAKLISKEL